MPHPRPNRGWIWYFAILAALSVAAIIVLVRFNLSQQLTPEQLAAARALWQERGPRNYDLEYNQQGSTPETRKVWVRDGQVVRAVRDGEPLEERLYRYSDIPALFRFLADYLREDAAPGRPRVFCKAAFDPQDGHLLHYVRRVMGTSERVEITVELHAVPPGAPVPGAKK